MSSASIEQRSKTQVSNGENDVPKEAEFSYMQSQVPAASGYTGMPMTDNDPYLSYYAASYMPYPPQDDMSSGMWSSTDQIPYQYSGDYSTMMAAADYAYPQPGGFGWFPGGDSGPWGSNLMAGDLKGDQAYPANYYSMEMPVYGGMNGQKEDSGVKSLDQSMKGMTIGSKRNNGSDSSSAYINGSLAASSSKKATWATIASQPAQSASRPRAFPRAPLPSGRNAADYGMWDTKNDSAMMKQATSQPHEGWAASRKRPVAMNSAGLAAGPSTGGYRYAACDGGAAPSGGITPSNTVLDKLVNANLYNPKEFDLNPKAARYFIIKSYSEDDIHRSIKYGIWCSTEYGNKRLDAAFREREGKGQVYLFFSVNGSGHFCGMAEMTSAVDYHATSGVWAQSKWKGQFEVKWIYVKDVPNSQLRHIKLENNENKPVTNSRDTQEVPSEKGKQVLRILHQYRHTTSIFDDFSHYEKRQEEESTKKQNDSD